MPPPEGQWIQVYRETLEPLYRYVSRRAGGDRELAEDVTQEAWLRAISAWRKKGPPDDPAAWLKRVARNLLMNTFRKQQPIALDRVGLRELDLEAEELEPANPNAAALLSWGLSRLRDGQARLLEAYHFDGKGVAVLAAEFGLSERAVEGRLRRSRLALRQCLSPYFREPGDEG